VLRQNRIDVGCPRDPPTKSKTAIPCGLNGLHVIEAEPSRARRRRSAGVDRNDFEIHVVSQPQEMVVSSHVRMDATIRDIDIETGPHMGHPIRERGSDD
jgi:hypothetical protein